MAKTKATVISVTRRYVTVCDPAGNIHLCKTAKRELEPFVGDEVTFEIEKKNLLVSGIATRKNKLLRCYFGKEKTLAANLDLLLIITAPPPLWNPNFIDRAYSAALSEKIPVALIVNKSDLDMELANNEPHLQAYRSIKVPIFNVSAKVGTNTEQLVEFLSNQQLKNIAITGVSGVGKSTLLNRLVPEAQNRTQTVSEKTGQGRQTTSQSLAYLYPEKERQRFLIDLPGIQNYGVSHLTTDQIVNSFGEFRPFAQKCRFTNCTHRNELECGVKEAVKTEEIPRTRYDSYLQMRQEVEEANSFD